ncbi:hypothetical protein UPYG_G00045920 [Umbra pygmaea]|uniref:HECT domain-containing protein n=1 Tax=Umbra pygmaea TaxID=75934 RepID=A0ABD0XTT0_UMBPY
MFSWGENAIWIKKVFGLAKKNGLENTTSEPTVNFIRTKALISHLAVGNDVVAFIRFGNDGKQQVSIGWMQKDGNGQWMRGKLSSVECKKKLLALSCGNANVILLSEEGRVLCLTASSNVPGPVGDMNQVIQVACGDQHSVALTKYGIVYTWGQNTNGQLGLGKGKHRTSSPHQLKSLSGIPLAQITAGGDHSFALSLSGAVFGWGKNNTGQLGLGDTIDRLAPAAVCCLNLKKTISVSCGAEHTAVLTKGGVVFTFGSGRYGQLGHNSLTDELRPRIVAELWGSKVTQIACGRNHTLAFVESFVKIYSFGCGMQGQLGNVVTVNQSVPLPVRLSEDNVGDQQIELIFAGGNDSFALCRCVQESKKGLNDSRLGKFTLMLDDETIDRWISECESKSWKTIQTEITKVFSSASCLNASFLNKSRDKHYQTSLKDSGVDLSLARLAFQKLAKKTKVLDEVKEVVLCKLLPSLNKNPIGVESMRVYLILPELLRVLNVQSGGEITDAFGAAILRLNKDKLQVLEGLWSTIPDYYFRTTVKVFHSVSSELFKQIAVDHRFPSLFEVLQKLYDVNCKRHRRIPVNTFHINNVRTLLHAVQSLYSEMQQLDFTPYMDENTYCNRIREIEIQRQSYEDNISLLKNYPCILDTENKCTWLWMFELDLIKRSHGDCEDFEFCSKIMMVDRKTLVDNTFQHLRQMTCHMGALKVQFHSENGVDQGGVSLEFFRVFANEVGKMKQKILKVYPDSGLAWFTADDFTDEFYLLGLVCGKALYNQCVVNLCFPLALFKKLLGLSLTLDDLKELAPDEASGLQYLLDQDEDGVEALDIVFMDKRQELIPNGENVLVTTANRKKYVDLRVDMELNKSVKRQFTDFEKGFHEGCPTEAWRMFLPEELMIQLQGEDNYEWDKLRQNAKYEGYKHTDGIIQNFWSVFTDFSVEEKKTFLTFLTGTDRLPRGRSLSKLQMTITNLASTDADEHYPKAQTCFLTLCLPNYSSVDILQEKLRYAINHCEVFGDY